MTQPTRLFFGIALPTSVQRALIAWRSTAFPAETGRPVAAANLHLTLAFLGDVTPGQQARLSAQAGRIRQRPFRLALDDAGHWPASGAVWIGPHRAPRGLHQLATLLRSQAARGGCYQSPLPFHPHVTLLRGATRPVALPPRTFHWSFPVSQFSLFASESSRGGVRYRPIAHWPLTDEDTHAL
ncbi:RNA 2',3'-cyclic phosphodiesterase [Pantoea sp. 1.19]|uniref:RNA 2',3'-cyclic phosphodiesterase n=1 Tax=Pantoea sp. 1.19 TaxID=1925589 RepID=UPI00094902BE|nr:RNA 2',3'-cyclic phosphodiesterase [Pantoea sp. 1.19]